jgi:rare lipoprotein A (peptidoglycan hydrolase)
MKFDFKRVFGWRSFLVAAAMIQSCSTMSGSVQRLDSDPQATQAVDKLIAGENSRLESTNATDKTEASNLTKPAHWRKIGVASWYGPRFIGKKTASGDIFDGERFTAAHKTLPLGSKARVTNLINQKSVDVEINDRGPFIDGRIIDLSEAAARVLDMIDRGTVKVKVELLDDPVPSEDAPSSQWR